MKYLLESFGYLHGPPPNNMVVVNVSDLLYDPHLSPDLKYLTGKDVLVRESVLNSIEVINTIYTLTDLMASLSHMSCRPGTDVLSLAVGCRGGRHRSVVIVDEVAKLLGLSTNLPIEVNHIHINLPVIER
jgi:UPF0042 nucleotide-binding protein